MRSNNNIKPYEIDESLQKSLAEQQSESSFDEKIENKKFEEKEFKKINKSTSLMKILTIDPTWILFKKYLPRKIQELIKEINEIPEELKKHFSFLETFKRDAILELSRNLWDTKEKDEEQEENKNKIAVTIETMYKKIKLLKSLEESIKQTKMDKIRLENFLYSTMDQKYNPQETIKIESIIENFTHNIQRARQIQNKIEKMPNRQVNDNEKIANKNQETIKTLKEFLIDNLGMQF